MKFILTLNLEAESYSAVESLAQDAFGTGVKISSIFAPLEPAGVAVDTPAGTVTMSSVPAPEETPAEGPNPDEESVEEAAARKRSEASKKAAATKAKNKAAAAAKKGKAAAPAATEGALKKAVKAAVEATGLDAVRSVFAGFTGKSGDPCEKLSDVKPADYGAVIEALG